MSATSSLHRISSFFIAVIILACLALAGQVIAQQSPSTGNTKVDPRLEQVPLELNSIGLTIHPPLGANVAAQRHENNLVVSLAEPITNPRWSVTLQMLDSSMEIPSAEGQVDEHLKSLEKRGTLFEVISNQRVIINNTPSQLCYIKQSTAAAQDYISGWLVVPAGRRTFLVASILAIPDSFEEFHPTLEASFATIALVSQEELSLQIRTDIEVGKRVLESITPEKLQSIAANTAPQWRRVYMPASGSGQPEQEIGYMHVDVFAGDRTLFNPDRHILNYDDSERIEGLVVQVYVRVLEGKDIRDVEMLYWMSWDQKEENFSVRGTRRQGSASLSEAITGVRSDQRVPSDLDEPELRPGERRDPTKPKQENVRFEPMLTVVTSTSQSRARDPSQWIVPDAYLSQALNWVLASALPRDGEKLAYACYFFDMAKAQPSLQRRLDTWEPLAETPSISGTTQRWQLSSQMGEEEVPIVTLYAADGTFLKRTHPDGAVTVPIELPALKRLWESKRLPISADDIKRPSRRTSP